MMDIASIDTGLIYRPPSARQLDRSRVDELARSMAEIGILSPIHVKRAKHYRGADQIDAFDIIAGNHRYEAALVLKWHELPCVIIDTDALHAELIEIDENLIRHNLTPAQEAAALTRRKTIYEELHPETKAEAFKGNRHTGSLASENSAFTSATAETTGKSRRSVEIAAARGAALGDDLAEIAGTSLDKGVELDALAKMKPEQRKPIIDRAKAGECVSARKEPKLAADPLPDVLASERQVARLMDAWNAAGPEARQEFLLRIDTPVFERGAA
jgi:ParB/RepB/Spo0J family partition protein